jgi:Domain of unknown function (DUF4926)
MYVYDDGIYEVEFTNAEGETMALCLLSPQHCIVVWQAKTRRWQHGTVSDLLAQAEERH